MTDQATAMEGWYSALEDAWELVTNAPDERYEKRARAVVGWIATHCPTPTSRVEPQEKG
jgi:hypothetical protein